MQPVTYMRPTRLSDAIHVPSVTSDAGAPVIFLAGGTQVMDLAKLDVIRPTRLVDLTHLNDPELSTIQADQTGLRLGAMVTMRSAAENGTVLSQYPVLAQSLAKAASQQIRNMGRLGGNVLQRTRCAYFRDTQWRCNKRTPGQGCDAIEGIGRWNAVLGTSAHCVASYPGDWAVAMIALDASVNLLGPQGLRTIPFADLHRLPGSTPHLETTLRAGEVITSFLVPAGPWTQRSLYLKIRDRESYEFGLATVAVALDLENDKVRAVRLGLGGPVSRPWRLHEVEEALTNKRLTEAAAAEAAELAFRDAQTNHHNAFRVSLAKAAVVRALLEAKELPL